MIILYLGPITRQIEEDVSDLLTIPLVLLYLLIDFIICSLCDDDDE